MRNGLPNLFELIIFPSNDQQEKLLDWSETLTIQSSIFEDKEDSEDFFSDLDSINKELLYAAYRKNGYVSVQKWERGLKKNDPYEISLEAFECLKSLCIDELKISFQHINIIRDEQDLRKTLTEVLKTQVNFDKVLKEANIRTEAMSNSNTLQKNKDIDHPDNKKSVDLQIADTIYNRDIKVQFDKMRERFKDINTKIDDCFIKYAYLNLTEVINGDKETNRLIELGNKNIHKLDALSKCLFISIINELNAYYVSKLKDLVQKSARLQVIAPKIDQIQIRGGNIEDIIQNLKVNSTLYRDLASFEQQNAQVGLKDFLDRSALAILTLIHGSFSDKFTAIFLKLLENIDEKPLNKEELSQLTRQLKYSIHSFYLIIQTNL